MKEYKLLCIRAMIFEQQYDYTNMDIMQLENFKMVGAMEAEDSVCNFTG